MTEVLAVPSYAEGLGALVKDLTKMLPAQQFAVFNADADRLAIEHADPLVLHAGDKAPQFELPNATGRKVSLASSLGHGPVVLTFYRGAWCPYCNLQLGMYQQILPRIREAGASLVAVSPMIPDQSLAMRDAGALEFEVLSDVGNAVARRFTTVFTYSDASRQAMTDLGYDFFSFYGDDSAGLPVPATFVIGRDGTIRFAASEGGDYRRRVEPRAILEALEA